MHHKHYITIEVDKPCQNWMFFLEKFCQSFNLKHIESIWDTHGTKSETVSPYTQGLFHLKEYWGADRKNVRAPPCNDLQVISADIHDLLRALSSMSTWQASDVTNTKRHLAYLMTLPAPFFSQTPHPLPPYTSRVFTSILHIKCCFSPPLFSYFCFTLPLCLPI